MNNMELTRSVELLNSQFTDPNNRLNIAVPDLSQKIAESASAISTMLEAVKSDIKPFVDQIDPMLTKIVENEGKSQEESGKLQRLVKNMTSKLSDLANDMQTMKTKMQQTQDAIAQTNQKYGVDVQTKIEMEVKSDQLGAKVDQLLLEIDHVKGLRKIMIRRPRCRLLQQAHLQAPQDPQVDRARTLWRHTG